MSIFTFFANLANKKKIDKICCKSFMKYLVFVLAEPLLSLVSHPLPPPGEEEDGGSKTPATEQRGTVEPRPPPHQHAGPDVMDQATR